MRFRISSETLISALKSVAATHRRRTSAPKSLTTCWGDITLPRDLDIFRPSASTVKPCVKTARYGALPLMAMAVFREDWNQPRC